MVSRTRGFIDDAHPYVCTKTLDELLDFYIATDGFKPKVGKDIGGFIPNWIGQFYAYYQWFYNVRSVDIIKHIPVEYLLQHYPALHDLDLRLAVKRVGNRIKP